jgi:signal transduction histidine kinase
MNLFWISGLLVGVTSLALGIYVLFQGTGQRLRQIWCCFAASVAVWGFGSAWIATASTEKEALLAWRFAYLFGVIWIPIFFYYFFGMFCDTLRERWVRIHYAIGFFFVPFLLFSPSFFSGVRRVFSSFYYATPGTLFFVFLLWWVALVVSVHIQLFRRSRDMRLSRQERSQAKWILIAFVLAYSTGSLCYLPILGINVYPYGNFGILFFPIIMLYAIGAYQFLDIRTVLHKTLLWIVTLITSLLPLGVMAALVQDELSTQYPLMLFIWNIFLFGVVLLYARFIQPRIDQLFQRRKYDLQEALGRFLKEIRVLVQMEAFTNKVDQTLRETLSVSRAVLLLWDAQKGGFQSTRRDGEPDIECLKMNPFIQKMQMLDRVVRLEEVLDDPDGRSCFQGLKAQIILPMRDREGLIGLLCLGEKQTLMPYSFLEIDFLETLRSEISIALSNTLLYEDVRRLKESLAMRVAEMEVLNEELEKFSYSVSHDLRAPLRSIEGFGYFLQQRSEGNLDQEGREYLSLIRKAAKQMSVLIDDLLTLSRINRTEICRVSVNLSDLAGDILSELQRGDPARRVESVIAEGLMVNADPGLMYIALGNLIRNAWKYTRNEPAAVIEIGAQSNPSGKLVFFVRDNGVGFDMQYVHKLFAPFQRLHGASEFEGTGIGLATVSRIMTRHGGRIWGEGVVGQGATFYFTL